MSVVISQSLTIADVVSGGGVITADNPIIGWRTLVTAANITATSAATGFPASNLANPSTNLRWVGLAASPAVDEYLTMALNTVDDIDYIAIARHNLGSAQIPVSVEALDTGTSPASWVEIIADTLLGDDGPALFRFARQAVASIRLRLQPGTAAPSIAVVYAGALLVLQRQLYVGHTPIDLGRQTTIVNARSESGNFLGRIVLGRSTETAVALKNLTPDWYRANMDPFVVAAQEQPFFFAWRPQSYPAEVGYAWLTGDPKPQNALSNGMMKIDLKLAGIV